MNVLDLTGRAADQFPDAQVYYEGDLLHPDALPPFDVIVTDRLLSVAERGGEALQPLVERLAPGGEIHLLEPSAEWAAREILANRTTVPLDVHMHGRGDTRIQTLYTLIDLRDLLVRAGLLVGVAVTRPYPIATTEDGRAFEGDQHYLVGIKPGGALGEKQWLP